MPATRPVFAALGNYETIVGLRLGPGMAPSLLNLPAKDILDSEVGLSDAWSAAVRELTDRLRETPSERAKLRLLEAAVLACVRLWRRPTSRVGRPRN